MNSVLHRLARHHSAIIVLNALVTGAASSSANKLYRLAKMSPLTRDDVFLAAFNRFAASYILSCGKGCSYVLGNFVASSGVYS